MAVSLLVVLLGGMALRDKKNLISSLSQQILGWFTLDFGAWLMP
jgi:hypothetical protein